MSDKEMALKEVTEQYKGLCHTAGQLSYQIEVQKRELQQVMAEMSSLNLKASELAKAQAKKGETNG